MPMLSALMWIVRYALMRGLMNLQNFVELERLLRNGLQGWTNFNVVAVIKCFVPGCYVLAFVRAMGGSVPFEEALAARLSLFEPFLSQVQSFLDKRPPRISPGIEELVKKLKDNKRVYLISGGFRQIINPVASILEIPLENISTNRLLFEGSGDFPGFDKSEPTSRSGGKATAVQQIRKAHGYRTLVMIGDVATDLKARKPGGADLFICCAGVQLREAVATKSDWLIF